MRAWTLALVLALLCATVAFATTTSPLSPSQSVKRRAMEGVTPEMRALQGDALIKAMREHRKKMGITMESGQESPTAARGDIDKTEEKRLWDEGPLPRPTGDAWQKANEKDVETSTSLLQLQAQIEATAPPPLASVVVPGKPDTPPMCLAQADWEKALSFLPTAPKKRATATSGVRVLSAPYLDADGEPERYQHMFIQMAKMVTVEDIAAEEETKITVPADCYEPGLEYKENLADVTAEDMEAKSGCTAVRTNAKIVQEFTKCLAWGGMDFKLKDECVLYQIAFVATSTPFTSVSKFVDAVMDKIDRKCLASGVQMKERKYDIIADCLRPNEKSKSHFPEQLRAALQCYAPMVGAGGALKHGTSAHVSKWVVGGFDNIIKECNVAPACARLAAAWVNGFQLRPYDKGSYWGIHDPSSSRCRSTTADMNCRLWSRCWHRGLRKLCAVEPKCCPTAAVHTACATNTKDNACKDNICISPA